MNVRILKGCLFLDSCVLISEVLNENDARIRKLKADVSYHSIRCFFSNSVEKETNNKIASTVDFLGNALKETIQIHLDQARALRRVPVTEPITNDDIKALERLFDGLHRAVRTSGVALPNPLSFVEAWVISYLAKILEEGRSIGIDDFVREMVKSVLKLTAEIQTALDYLITFEKGFVKRNGVSFSPIVSASLNRIGVHPPDSDHIASAIANQCSSNETTIFVTLDFSTILSKRDVILSDFRMLCCDPLYAIHHL